MVVTNVLEIDENVPTFLTSDSEPVDPEVIRHWFEENVRGRDVRILLRDSAGLDHSFADVGVGLSQVVPFLVASRRATTGSAIAIEQPELHVHPATQTGIGDVLARSVTETNREVLYLIETHSEHILLRLLRRVREAADGSLESPELGLRAGDLSINYVESKNGRSVIKNLRVDTDGEFIDHWPNGFFEERYDEIF